ncbi:MAG TPA: NAD(P)/FAD-dependent oxidoreductase [Methanobacteriaceae archaeon]|nr:NAD(P)/FAD-dependent oxidoreductase [Methanobacteriaceae archaeon]
MTDYDVVVVGAGPVGSTYARHMAEKGFSVAILEKKKNVGVPLQCAGLLGKKIKNINKLPSEFILNDIYGAYLHSPSDIVLKVAKKIPEAYVIDRVAYDEYLSEIAVESGAHLFLNHRVEDVDVQKGEVYVKNQEKISAEVVVGADGYNSLISRLFNPSSEAYGAAQYLVKTSPAIETDYVHLTVDSRLSPGFLWSIPISESLVRVGLFSRLRYPELNLHLQHYLKRLPELKNSFIIKKYHGHIPVYDPKKKVNNGRTLLLGDAASQVKPTTGGGLMLGFICAKRASEITAKAIETGNMDILSDYTASCHKKFGRELKTQLMVQKIFQSLNDEDLDFMFEKLKEEGAEDLISEYGDMDTQSPLVKEMLKRGVLFSVLPKMLSRRISSLWK